MTHERRVSFRNNSLDTMSARITGADTARKTR